MATTEELATVTVDVSTLTLGEAAKAEIASGLSLQEILRSSMARKILAMFVHELRTSEQPRSWSDLSSLRLLDASRSTSPSDSTGTREK